MPSYPHSVRAVAFACKFRRGRRATWALQTWAQEHGRIRLLDVLDEGQELEERTGKPVGLSAGVVVAYALQAAARRAAAAAELPA